MWNLIKAVLLALLLLPVPGLCWAQEQPITITPGQAAKWTSDLQQLQQELTQRNAAYVVAAAALTYSIIKK